MTRSAHVAVLVILAAAVAAPTEIEPVSTHIPADAAAAMVIPDLARTGRQVDGLFDQLNMGLFRRLLLPRGSAQFGVEQLGQLGLADPNRRMDLRGGAAVVLLDPARLGMDLPAYVRKELTPLTGAQPQQAQEQKLHWPIVAILPIRPDQAADPDAPAIGKQQIGGRELYTARVGSYLAVSPTGQAVEALLESKKSLAETIDDAHGRMIRSALAAVHVNNRTVNPSATALIDTLDTELKQVLGESPSFFALQATLVHKSLPYLRTWFTEQATQTVAVRIDPDGLIIQRRVSYLPESSTARALAAYQPQDNLLDRIDFQRGFLSATADAMPVQQQRFAELSKLAMNIAQLAVQLNNPRRGLDTQTLKDLRQTTHQLHGQVRGLQLRIQQVAPQPDADFPLALIARVDVDRQEAFRNQMQMATELFSSLMQQARGGAEAGYRLTYRRRAESAGERQIDQIDLSCRSTSASPEASDHLLLRARLTPAGEGQVLLAVSPSQRALLAAAADEQPGPVPSSIAVALRHMPEKPSSLILLHPQRFSAAVERTRQFLDPGAARREPMLTSPVPLAIGSEVLNGPAVRHTAFLPNELLRDAILLYMRSRQTN